MFIFPSIQLKTLVDRKFQIHCLHGHKLKWSDHDVRVHAQLKPVACWRLQLQYLPLQQNPTWPLAVIQFARTR